MISLLIFFKIFIVCLFGAISPGPSTLVVIKNGIFKNRYQGILTSIGHGIGITIYAIFAVLGIELIIKTNTFIFNSLRIFSVFFLIYLGLKSIYKNSNINIEKNLKLSVGSFFEGFSISILNPKIFIWFMAIYSHFMSDQNDIFLNIYLILIAGITDAFWYITLTILVTSTISSNFIKNYYYILQKVSGYVLIILSAVLLFEIFK